MVLDPKFEELYISAEKHDILNFNRQMIYFLRLCQRRTEYDVDLLHDELIESFTKANLCIECDTTEELENDQIVIDEQKLFLKVCPSCNNEFEV